MVADPFHTMRRLLLPLLSVCALALPLFATVPLFRNPRGIAVGVGGAADLTTGDFNGDGSADILIFRRGDAPRVSVHPGLGNGTFGAPIDTPIASPWGVAAGDANADGNPDVLYSAGLELHLRLGAGNGTFGPGAVVTVPGWQPLAVAMGDVTGDGRVDLIATVHQTGQSDRLAVAAANGSGGFLAPVLLSATSGLVRHGIIVADVNGDGRADVFTGDGWDAGIWFPSNGNGTFGASAALPGAPVGDLNGDGKVDLVDASPDAQREIAVHLRTAGGYAVSKYPIHSDDPRTGRVADVNLDGRPDLLLGRSGGDRTTVLFNRGDGTFIPPVAYAGIADSIALATADFDENNTVDIVSLDSDYHRGRISIAYGTGAGLNDAHRAYPVRLTHFDPNRADAHPRGARVEDVNGDGLSDVLTVTESSEAGDPSVVHITVLPGTGGGLLGAPQHLPTIVPDTYSGIGTLLRDFNGDGRSDVLLRHYVTYYSYLANGDGTFRLAAQFSADFESPHMRSGDFNGDGKRDLLSTHFFAGDGTGGFAAPVPANLDDLVSSVSVIGDVNGDQRDDYVSSGQVRIAGTDGTFAEGAPVTRWQQEESVVALVDLNHDGDRDLVSRRYDDALLVRLGNGDATFRRPAETRTEGLNTSEALGLPADFDGDGHIDLAISTQVFLGDGSGNFGGFALPRVLDTYSQMAAGDLDGNGSPDLVGISDADDSVDVFLTRRGLSQEEAIAVSLTREGTARYGQTVSVRATETHSAPWAPWGAALFRDNGTLFAVAPFGTTTATRPLTTGSHTLSVEFSGDDVFARGSAALAPFDVPRQTTNQTVFSSYNPSRVGSEVTFTVRLSWSSQLDPPTGTITLRDNGNVLGTFPAAAEFRYTTSALPRGSRTITAEYSGDTNYEPSTGTLTQVVDALPPAMTLTADPSTDWIEQGTEIIITVRFPSTPDITGTVTFTRNHTPLATVAVVGATAVFRTRDLPLDLQRVGARYNGDANWGPKEEHHYYFVEPRITGDDFNFDQKADIGWRDPSGGGTAFWMMNGTTKLSGSYGEPSPPSWTPFLGNFDTDRRLDIFWRNSDGANALWYMNGATKTSGLIVESLPAGWNVAAVADFDGDESDDILWRNPSTSGAMVWLMAGNTRQQTVVLENVSAAWTLAGAADFDADHDADLFWRNNDTGDNTIWLMQYGAKQSATPVEWAPSGWTAAGFGDFDGDGRDDVFWRHTDGWNAIWLMHGTTKKNGTVIEHAPTVWSVALIADFNGDGKSDVFWRASDGSNAMWLMDGTTKAVGQWLEWASPLWQVMK
jgi:Bacterial Ig-like domain (group 3)/FG-GAP-like repeat